ncbi:MAG: hypothetical protein C9356_11390 [Oleiphilus sp.]|nr:MAG: hypothetical protein C9356_11390 [Oleiphilus sp.]
MNKYVHISVLVGLLIWPVLSRATALTVVGDDNFPPYSFVYGERQAAAGIDVEILQEVARRLDIQFDIRLMPWKRLLLVTKRGDVFGSFALFKTPAREEYALFTHPVHYSTYRLFTMKSKDLRFDSIEDLYHKRIGIDAGFAISEAFDQARERGDIDVVELFDYQDAFNRLRKDGISAFAGNELVIRYQLGQWLQSIAEKDELIMLPKPVQESRGAFFVISKQYPMDDQDRQAWQQRITETLQLLEDTGFTRSIVDKYTDPPFIQDFRRRSERY